MARNEEEIFEKELKRELLSSNSMIAGKLDDVMKKLDSVSAQLAKLSEDLSCLATAPSEEESELVPEVKLEEKFGRRVM